MVEVRHGGFALDLPEGWSDQSTLLFIGPTGDGFPDAVSVKFSLDAPATPRAILDAQAAQLGMVDPDFTVLDDGPFHCGLGDGWRFVQRLTLDGVVMQQITAAVIVGGVTVIATASAGEARFAEQEAKLVEVLESMRSAG